MVSIVLNVRSVSHHVTTISVRTDVGRFLDLNVPKRQRDHTLLTEVAEVVELAAHEAVGAIGGDYGFHRTFMSGFN